MSAWVLLLMVCAAWTSWALAATAQRTVAQARDGIPEVGRRAVSILPIIPVFPLIAWGIALLLDCIMKPWGTTVIGVAHTALLVLPILSVVRDLKQLQSLK